MILGPSDEGNALRDGDALIIVPPFASIDRPSLAAHVLQACAAEAGFRVSVLYGNLLFAAAIGVDLYTAITEVPPNCMLGERLFARSAHGIDTALSVLPPLPPSIDVEDLPRVEGRAIAFSVELAEAISMRRFPIVGATTTFEQTNPSFALLARVKRARPDIITILGGANCDGEMADGIASINTGVDHIFSGECEAAFPAFLQRWKAGVPGIERMVRGTPCMSLDAIPIPDFTEYFEQRARFLPGGGASLEPPMLPYESSRGCWWGQKHHCTFCGLNGEGMAFREKSPDRVLDDLRALAAAFPARSLCMADNIMPHTYFKTLLPRLAADPLPLPLFYEQKANLSLEDVIALKQAGVTSIQPGIEALSTALLKRMDKGVVARQNLELLRRARAVGLDMAWNLLWGFPGDEPEAYEETLTLLPLLRHLQPPSAVLAVNIDRFSPYFQRPLAYGIQDLRPHPGYRDVLPPHADIAKIAYCFVGDYTSGSHRSLDTIRKIYEEVNVWRERWSPAGGARPVLRIDPLGDAYLLRDTRRLPGTEEALMFDRAEARIILRSARHVEGPATDMAIARRLGVVVDGYYVPLVTASPSLLMEIELEGQPDVMKRRLSTVST
jgi:ribosomal peptide maturation radical SAM protein 1